MLIFLIPLVYCGCTVPKIFYNEVEADKISKIKRLSSFLMIKDDKTFNLTYSMIKLPLRYDTITWTNVINGSFKGSELDSLHNKYLLYGKMLDSLLIYKGENKVKSEELVKYFGKPTELGTDKDRHITDLFYKFNTLDSPKCSDLDNFEHLQYRNCALLHFEIDNQGCLSKIHQGLFTP